MTVAEQNGVLRRAYYRGGGPPQPYRCRKCQRSFAVSDERREHERSNHKQRPVPDTVVDAYRASLKEVKPCSGE